MAKIKKNKSEKATVPCLRVDIGAKPGKTGKTDAAGCVIVGESRAGAGRFALKKEYGSTSKSVDYIDGRRKTAPKPCQGTKKRKTCPVQLVFDQGQPFLRFCRQDNEAGFRVDVNSPEEATKAAKDACSHWATHGSFDTFFPEGAPLRGLRGTRKRR
jgi:hypothetical protein